MITKAEKTAVIEANKTHEGDTGSPEVQIAILTERIHQLTEHLKVHRTTSTAVWACTRWSVSAAVCSTTSQRRTSSAIVRSLQS